MGSEMLPTTAAPTTVAFEALWGCNLGCFFCYLPEDAPGRQRRLVPPLGTSLEILRRIRGSGVKDVYLLGGEILLHHGFTALCQGVADLGFQSRGIVTNGVLIDPPRVALLKELGFWVNVSIRTLSEELHAKITSRRNRVPDILRALNLLTEAGIELGIEYDCLPDNYDRLFETIQYLQQAGVAVRGVYLHRMAPHGTGREHAERIRLGRGEYLVVLQQAAQIQSELGIPAAFEDGLPLCLFPSEMWKHIHPCDCGWSLATVDPLGDVRRCACHSAVLGNLFTHDLTDLWSRGLADFRSADWMDPACTQCSLVDSCRGGCAVSAIRSEAHGPDVFARDFVPFLDLRPVFSGQ